MLFVRPICVSPQALEPLLRSFQRVNSLLFSVAPSLPVALSQACPACLSARAVHEGAWTECK